jgi:hypothetical protein
MLISKILICLGVFSFFNSHFFWEHHKKNFTPQKGRFSNFMTQIRKNPLEI